MNPLTKILQGLHAIASFFYSLFTKDTFTGIGHFVANQVKAVITGVEELWNDAKPYLQPLEQTVVKTVQEIAPTILSDFQAAIAPVAGVALSTTEAGLSNNGPSTPDNADKGASLAMADAFGLGLASFGVSAVFESIFPEKLNTLNGIGPMLAQFAGFGEVAAQARNPLYRAAFGKALEYKYNAQYKPEFVELERALALHARGLITDGQLDTILGYSPIKADYYPALTAGAYRPVQPRAIAQAFVDVNFPEAQVRDLMAFAGNRPQDIDTMVEAFKERSTQNVRQSYLEAILTAAEQGTMTTADLSTAMTNLNFSPDAQNFVQLTVAVKKLQQLTTLYRKSVSEGYKYGTITDADYLNQLEAIGINPADAQAHYAVDSILKHGKELAASQHALAIEQGKEQRAAVQAAHASFQAGSIDETGLAAELATAGLSAPLIAFAVSVAQSRRTGSLQHVYGQLLAPAAAEQLRAQVADNAEQVYKALVTPDIGYQRLLNLSIPAPIAAALIQKAAAEAKIAWVAPQ